MLLCPSWAEGADIAVPGPGLGRRPWGSREDRKARKVARGRRVVWSAFPQYRARRIFASTAERRPALLSVTSVCQSVSSRVCLQGGAAPSPAGFSNSSSLCDSAGMVGSVSFISVAGPLCVSDDLALQSRMMRDESN